MKAFRYTFGNEKSLWLFTMVKVIDFEGDLMGARVSQGLPSGFLQSRWGIAGAFDITRKSYWIPAALVGIKQACNAASDILDQGASKRMGY